METFLACRTESISYLCKEMRLIDAGLQNIEYCAMSRMLGASTVVQNHKDVGTCTSILNEIRLYKCFIAIHLKVQAFKMAEV